jgi:PhzF family phenazine biosynthesis protein
MRYYHVDVFSEQPMDGNGLTVVFPERDLETAILLKITREFRQFETIFVFPQTSDGDFRARIFTVEEELAFAGHPILGAGAVLHHLLDNTKKQMGIRLLLPEKDVVIQSEMNEAGFIVTMDQGIHQRIGVVGKQDYPAIARSLNIDLAWLDSRYPVEVISTGLPYLLVPICEGIGKVKITHPEFESFLGLFGAKFVYVFDTGTLECRTWDNAGIIEDVATGSAAGPLGAYLVQNGFRKPGEIIKISQGKYVGRPSIIHSWVEKENGHVCVQGNVSFFGKGEIFI